MQKIKDVMKSMGVIVLLYSILVFTGGVIGFITKKSLPSLLMGSLFGLSLLFASVKILTLRKWALYFALGLILTLDAFFSYRLVTSFTLFPAGIMVIITMVVLILLVLKLRQLNPSSKKMTN